MKKLLYVDGCVFRETSRTERLARAYLSKALSSGNYALETVILEDELLTPLDGETLKKRDLQIKEKDFSDAYYDYAKSFVSADEVVIAVPYWDMNFPSHLKIYLEHLCICGLTFRYSEHGRPEGLTNVKKVTYVTTAGGYTGKCNFGFDYVKGLMQNLFCIPDVSFISAEGLDVAGNDPDAIMDEAISSM